MQTVVKDYFRTIKKCFHQFVSIVLIIALGTGFYSGLKSTGPDMRKTADKFYIEAQLMDFKITGNYGIDNGDLDLLRSMPSVKWASGGFEADIIDKEFGDNIHVISIPQDGDLNQIQLIDGRLPQSDNECVIDVNAVNSNFDIGKKIKPTLKNIEISDILTQEEFEIVGTVTSPLYTSKERGISTVGNGMSDGFIMVNPDVFVSKDYTYAYVRLQESETISSFSDEYSNLISREKNNLNAMLSQGMQGKYFRLSEDPMQKINEAEDKLKEANQIYANAEKALEDGRKELSQAKEIKDVGQQEVDQILDNINKNDQLILDLQSEIQEINIEIENISQEVETKRAQIHQIKQELEKDQKEFDNNIAVKRAIKKTDEERAQIQKEQSELEKRWQDLDKENIDLNQLTSRTQELNNKISGINSDINKLKSENILLTQKHNAVSEIQQNKESSLKESQEKIDQAEKDLKESEQIMLEKKNDLHNANLALSRMEKIFYYINDRSVNPGYSQYGNNADRIDTLSNIFPVFFVIISALVCYTTMTRMVEEDTVLIGTYKAMGYEPITIMGKYLVYAFCAALSGCIIGLTIGFKFFPVGIMKAYNSLYNMPLSESQVYISYTIYAVVASMACTMLTAVVACNKELKMSAAQLMRPKTPKNGKRILLEKITFLWNMFSFNMKVTARNVFRYKRRTLMTVLGIAGGTALMLTGFGLKNSLADVINLQYDQIFKYDMKIFINENTDDEQRKMLDSVIEDTSSERLYIYEKSIDVVADIKQINASLLVGEGDVNISNFINLRDRETKEHISFEKDSVILTEKLALSLGVDVGDVVSFRDNSNIEYIATITNITENYVDHYVYMGEFIYSQYFGSVPEYTTILVKDNGTLKNNEASIIAESLNKEEFVRSIDVMDLLKTQYNDLVNSMNIVVIALIVSAALMAFIVLYNLSAINISERKRELSTIKVLGFYDNEVGAYIGRENIILTIIGIALGLIGGIYLCRFVVITTEVENIMFGRTISSWCYIVSIALTILFAFIVNFVMSFTIKKIDMVQALKSVD